MNPDKYNKKLLLIPIAVSFIFPLVIIFLLSPLIDRIMISESEAEAYRLAEHIAKSFQLSERVANREVFSPTLIREVEDIKRQFNLYKVSLFSEEGEILFSTDPRDFGTVRFGEHFKDMVSNGVRQAVFKRKGENSLEGIPVTADVIESYLPLMSGGRFMGAVKVGYDITEAQDDFRHLKNGFSIVLFLISLSALSATLFFLRKAEHRRLRQAETEEELSREQLKAETVFSSMGDNVIIQDRDYRIIYQNRVNKEIFGDHKGEYCYKVYEGIDYVCPGCPVEMSYGDGMIHRVEKMTDTPNGHLHMELTASPLRDSSGNIIAGIKVVRDVTEKKRLEEQLRHSQKMEALGTLTSGISHEFNNLLAAIIGYSEILQDELPQGTELRKRVDVIHEAGRKAETLTKGLLAYSRKQITMMSPIAINEVIHDIQGMLAKIIGVDVSLRTLLSDEPLVVMADRNQLEQALINVMANAKDAMPEGGDLIIKTEKVTMDRDFIKGHGFGKGGHYAVISVRDSGHGMDENTRKKVFEPFFTTKDVGKGTGLGLSIVYGIVKNHYGFVDVVSEPGKGTDFVIYLPLVESTSQ